LFFVADGSGGHTFAETYEAHLRNVARWREINSAAAAAAEAAAPPADAGAADAGAGDAGAGEAEPSGAADAQTSDPPPPAAAPDASTGSDDKPLQLQPRMRPAQ
ncbi:MAG: aminodeoxychorismate lyase, partial [Bauldia sp.]